MKEPTLAEFEAFYEEFRKKEDALPQFAKELLKQEEEMGRYLFRRQLKLLRCIQELRGIIVSHHSSTVMRDEYTLCPVCESAASKKVLDEAYQFNHPWGDE